MAKKFKLPNEKPPNHERWLISYADFITLLMVFFIVMYAMSAVDQKKYEELASSLGGALVGGPSIIDGGKESILDGNDTTNTEVTQTTISIEPTTVQVTEPIPIYTTPDVTVEPISGTDIQKFTQIQSALQSYFSNNNLNQNISMQITNDGLLLTLKEKFLFAIGRADVNKENKQVLVEIARTLDAAGNDIMIKGFTDDLPISSTTYPSNWELSADRALQVLHIFQDDALVSGEKLTALGRGEYDKIADNGTEQGRSENRRIEILLESSNDDTLPLR